MVGAKVLLVDDEADFTEVLASRMQTRGLEVEIAGSGPEAIQKAQGRQFDAVILDLAMPGMDGIETLKRLLALNPDLQVILLTGHATVQKGIEAVKSGAVEFLEKPASLELLLEKIEKAQTDRLESAERRVADEINDILRSKGW